MHLASRASDQTTVAVRSGQPREQFDDGLSRFLDEARTLARFDQHPSIVGVRSFFRANGTGYMVMEYVDGVTLKTYLECQGGRIPFETARALLMPVMDALRAVHKVDLLHRDIAPDNIYIATGGQIKLLDFGAARQAVRDKGQSLSMIFKPGYAPWEQCHKGGRQGRWTDVYGLAATLYRCIAGAPPPEAPDRMEQDALADLPCWRTLGRYELTFAQWDACVADGGCSHRTHDQGWGWGEQRVINVSWDDAQTYVDWLSRVTGKQHRLPSEAEWECAARAGTETAFGTGGCIHAWQANYNDDYDYNTCGANTGSAPRKSQPVGAYPANLWGLYDMHGNAWEWTEDCWNDSYAGAPADGTAWQDGDCTRRILRGGSWGSSPRRSRSAYRGYISADDRNNTFGFRVARTLAP